MFFKNLLKKNINFNLIRNSLNFKPSAYISPKIKKTSVSDFFFYKESDNFNSKIVLFNLSSHVLPEIKQTENIKLFFFNQNGILIKESQINLNYQETKEIIISDIIKNEFGSFFAFHIFDNFGDLIEKNSFITERGYAAYKSKESSGALCMEIIMQLIWTINLKFILLWATRLGITILTFHKFLF